MIKYPRVYVQPRDAIDCNQLQSLFAGNMVIYFGPIRAGCLVNVLLNIGLPSVYVGVEEKFFDDDPTVSVNELARQLKLWQLN